MVLTLFVKFYMDNLFVSDWNIFVLELIANRVKAANLHCCYCWQEAYRLHAEIIID